MPAVLFDESSAAALLLSHSFVMSMTQRRTVRNFLELVDRAATRSIALSSG